MPKNPVAKIFLTNIKSVVGNTMVVNYIMVIDDNNMVIILLSFSETLSNVTMSAKTETRTTLTTLTMILEEFMFFIEFEYYFYYDIIIL